MRRGAVNPSGQKPSRARAAEPAPPGSTGRTDDRRPRVRRGRPPRSDREKRELFFDVAETLFARFGFRKTTVEDVCREARASKRTFYSLFTDKVDLMAQVMMSVSTTTIERWREGHAPGERAADRLGRFLDGYVAMVRDHPMLGIVLQEVHPVQALGSIHEQPQFAPVAEALSETFAYGQSTGEFRDLDPGRVTWIIFALLDSLYCLIPPDGDLPSPLRDPALAEEVRTFIFQAVLAPGAKRPAGAPQRNEGMRAAGKRRGRVRREGKDTERER